MTIPYQIIRSSKRKTVGLQVKKGNVVVRAPYYVNEKQIANLIEQKQHWLNKHVERQREKVSFPTKFKDQSVLLIEGKPKKLVVKFYEQNCYTPKAQTKIIIEEEHQLKLYLALKFKEAGEAELSKKIKSQLEYWLKSKAESLIEESLKFHSESMGLSYSSIKIRQYKSRWGGCNSKGQLSFNYLLAMTPRRVIDYVVVHELSHLIHLNHSQDFWLLVGKYLPNYHEAKNWLKENQSRLVWQ